MKYLFTVLVLILLIPTNLWAQSRPMPHPDTSSEGWQDLFNEDLSNTIKPENVWSFEDGILTASEDINIWSTKVYDNFVIDLEFKTAEGTNSGVIIYVSDTQNWIPNSVEVQIADDYAKQWAEAPATWQCGAIFGHLPASKRMVKQPGEWNRYTIIAMDEYITVVLNGEVVAEMDMKLWTSATTNPDGSEIPEWLSTPFADLPTFGHVGFQGKHAGAPIYFKNIRIKELPTRQPSITLPAGLDRVLRDYEDGWQGRDAEKLASLFTEDGFILRPGHSPVRGRANIQQAYANSGGPLYLRALEYDTNGSTGYIIGEYSRSEFLPASGKYILTLREESGQWMITADMDNGNN